MLGTSPYQYFEMANLSPPVFSKHLWTAIWIFALTAIWIDSNGQDDDSTRNAVIWLEAGYLTGYTRGLHACPHQSWDQTYAHAERHFSEDRARDLWWHRFLPTVSYLAWQTPWLVAPPGTRRAERWRSLPGMRERLLWLEAVRFWWQCQVCSRHALWMQMHGD